MKNKKLIMAIIAITLTGYVSTTVSDAEQNRKKCNMIDKEDCEYYNCVAVNATFTDTRTSYAELERNCLLKKAIEKDVDITNFTQ